MELKKKIDELQIQLDSGIGRKQPIIDEIAKLKQMIDVAKPEVTKPKTVEQENESLVNQIKSLDDDISSNTTLKLTVERLNAINADTYMQKLKHNLIELIVLNEDITSIKQQLAWNLGIAGDSPEMQQLHEFISKNADFHNQEELRNVAMTDSIKLIREEMERKLADKDNAISDLRNSNEILREEVRGLHGNIDFKFKWLFRGMTGVGGSAGFIAILSYLLGFGFF